MAVVDKPIKITLSHNFQRERGTPVGDSPWSAKIEITQETAFVLGNGGSSSRHVDDDDDDFVSMGKGGMPAGSLESVKTEMGQKTSLAHPKLTLVNNGGSENEQVKRPGSRYEVRTITITYKRKRRWPAKSKIAHKPMLIDNGSSSDAKSDKGDDYEPPTKSGRPESLITAKSKRGRPGSKSAKNKEDVIGSSKPGTDFDVVKSFRSFKVIVDGSAINDKLLPTETRRAYHGLCHDRKSLLHGRMQKPICPLLAAGVIIEMVHIAEGIRASAASPSCEDLTRWKKALESFEMMGMDIGFMRERVDSLMSLLDKIDHQHEGYETTKLEWPRATKELRAHELKLSSIKDALKEIDVELQDMASSSAKKETVDQAARQLAATQW